MLSLYINVLLRAAGGRALTHSEILMERGDHYEYIRGIHGDFDYGAADSGNSKFDE